MDNWFYKVKIEVFDEIDKDNIIEYGIVYGANLVDITHQLSEYYGEDNIQKITISPIHEGPIFQISEERYNQHEDN